MCVYVYVCMHVCVCVCACVNMCESIGSRASAYTASTLISAQLPLLAVQGWRVVLGGGGQCVPRAGVG